jgi:hypothetical protein
VLAAVEALSGADVDRVLEVADGAAAAPKLPDGWPDHEAP